MSLFVERRRPTLTPDLLIRVFLAWAMISALLLVTNLSAILAHRLPDPDDTLRLVQVRDLIAGQGWSGPPRRSELLSLRMRGSTPG